MSTASATASAVSATPSAKGSSKSSFPTPSFVSPAPAVTAHKEQLQRTLSGGIKKRQQKRKLDRELQLAATEHNNSSGGGLVKAKKHRLSSSPGTGARLSTQQQQMKLKMKARAVASAFATPQRAAPGSSNNTETKRVKKPLQDISNSSSSNASTAPVSETSSTSSNSPSTQRKSDVPTRKLDFNATPDKPATSNAPKKQRSRADDAAASVGPVTAAASDSSSSSGSDDSSSDSGYSSDEAEVAFDAVTLGNTRVIREAESPYSSASTASTSSSVRPVGLEYRFAVSSTVSSIAIAPNGQFLVVGFYNGTIYLYPLTKDATRFRGGVLLDHITARGMYTQLMVRVALPDDGKFIFAGVYRGSTEIRAFEVDSIAFPSSSPSTVRARSTSDASDDDDNDFGASHAHAVTHTYSDPKLKGFGAVKSVVRSKTNATEYHLLCGLGIKNVHLWRFFQHAGTKAWSWECVFDKQANGISLEYLSFHPSEASQIISKSEHQNIRVWTLEEEFHDDDFTSVTLSKVSHVDVKHTVDTTAVYGDYAYGGSEALAMIDLRTASRLELDLPLSPKEQQAQLDAAAASKQSSARITASMRQRNSRRRGGAAGADELGGTRHMRTVSQVAGRATSPFTIGMCSDGSVFVHKPESALGMATPLEYVEGYERFFQDPSLSFQAQFSDLTRVNTSGLLSVLPLPATEREQWMIVAANQDQLLVRSLKAFLCRNQQVVEQAKVKRGLRNVMRDLGRGGAESSDAASSSESGSGSSSESDSEDEEILIEKSVLQSLLKPAAKLLELSSAGASASASQSPLTGTPVDSSKAVRATTVTSESDGKRERSKQNTRSKAATLKDREQARPSDRSGDAPDAHSSLEILSEQAEKSADAALAAAPTASAQSLPLVVTTPKRAASSSSRSSRSNLMTPCPGGVASPVVSVSSLSSGTSNPNTPEPHAKLSQRAKQLLVLKDLEWTPPPKAPTSASAVVKSSRASGSGQSSTEGVVASTKTSKPRTKALFAATVDDDEDGASERHETPAAATSKTRSVSAGVETAPKAKKTSSKTKTSSAAGVNTAPSVAGAPSNKALKQQSAGAKKTESKRSPSAAAAAAPVVRKEKASKKRSKDDMAPAADESASATALDVEMADGEDDVGDDAEDDDDDDLEMLEANEPVFETTPLVSDGGLLLSASLFQFDAAASATSSSTASSESASDAAVRNEQASLLMHFAEQTARLKRSFDVEKERIYQQHDCPCGSSSSSSSALLLKRRIVESPSAFPLSGGGASGLRTTHWKKALSSDFLKRKQLKRRQKKQIALKLRQLHGRYRAQIHELLAVQRLQANALTARQRFNAMYAQLCQRGDREAVDVAEPQPLAISFPYPSLLSSLAP